MTDPRKVRVAINGYGVIGKRVADAIMLQPDMSVSGIADIVDDWRIRLAAEKGYRVFGATVEAVAAMSNAGIATSGSLADLLADSDIVIDCTPKNIGAANVSTYRAAGVKHILQGGEKHALTGHSFVAEASYASAVGGSSTRVVSCNTTSIVRTLTALKKGGLLGSARGTLLRRATDPWESHQSGIMNTLVPESRIPSRIALIRSDAGLPALNSIKEWMLDLGRPHGDLYEVALWEDMLTVEGDELFYAYMVDNQAIVIPETVDAIRALCGLEQEAASSIATTNASIGIGKLVARPGRQAGAP